MAQCSATSKRTGKRCRGQAVAGSSVCRMHGAKGGAPVLHGIYSKHAPAKIAARLQELNEDPELVGSRRHLALLESFILDRLPKLDAPSSEAVLDAVRLQFRGFTEVVDMFEAAIGPLADDGTKQGLAMLRSWHSAVSELLGQDMARRAAEAEIRELVQEATVVQKQETKRLGLIAKTITDRQFSVLIATLVDVVDRCVEDPDVKRRISQELARKILAGNLGGAGSQG